MKSKEILQQTFNISFFLATIISISTLAFSRKQRNTIAFERDGGKCHAPFPHVCNWKEQIEVHHIMPQRYAKHLGLEEEFIDTPDNALTICSNAHDVIHPDRVNAKKRYHQAKRLGFNSYAEMAHDRKEKLNNRKIYWVDFFDRQLRVIALRRTQEAMKKGWNFPDKKKRKIIPFPQQKELPMFAGAGD